MRLFIVRHGNYADDGSRDPPLSSAGRKQAEDAGKVIAMHSRVRNVFSSPLRRAVMTAEIISDAVGAAHIIMDCLEPEADAGGFIDVLHRNTGHDIAAVGHLPNLRLIYSLLSPRNGPERLNIEIGGMTCLNLSPSAEELVSGHEWTLTSDQVNEILAHDSR